MAGTSKCSTQQEALQLSCLRQITYLALVWAFRERKTSVGPTSRSPVASTGRLTSLVPFRSRLQYAFNRSASSQLLSPPPGVPSENVPSEHEADVGAVGGIGEDHLPQVVGRDPQPDGDGKEIDDLGGVGPKEMRPQDAAGALLKQDLEAGRGLAHPACVEPAG